MGITTDDQDINSDEISVKDLILNILKWYKYLLSKWPIIIGLGLLGSLFGFYYANSKLPRYTAVTTFVLQEGGSGGGLGSLASIASIAGVDLGGGGGGIFQGENILELYKSRTMIQKTLLTKIDGDGKKQLLINRYLDFNSNSSTNPMLKTINFLKSSSELSHKEVRMRDSILGSIVSDINKNYLNVAKIDKKLSIIKVEVGAPDEVFAKVFNEKIVENVNDFYKQTKVKKTESSIAILQHKTDSVRAVMNGAIFTAAATTDATPNLNQSRQTQRLVPIQRSQFSLEANKDILSVLVQNLEMSKMTLLKEAPLIQVIDEPVYPLIKDKFSKVKGIILGGFLFSFLTMVFLIVKLSLKRIMADDKSKQ